MHAGRASFVRLVWQGVLWGIVLSLLLAIIGLALGLGVYAYYARALPSPQELYARAASFKSTKIYDRYGRLLYEVADPTGGRRTLVRYEQIPSVLIDAVLATEDPTFFSNPGLDPLAIARALYYDLKAGDVVQGGSTITQQLVKNLFLTQERTLSRKIKEAILAAEVTRRYTKEEVLEIYLNEVYFGNLAYGVQAAAETYFQKPLSQLTLSEAALLAGLIQSPAHYDPIAHPEAARARRDIVLRLMYTRGFIDESAYVAALSEPLLLRPFSIDIQAPHMVMYVRQLLERQYGAMALYREGLDVYTTLDLDLQHLAEQVVREGIAELRQYKAGNGALVALDPDTGDVLAMVGSADFFDTTIDGQVNVVTSPRQPGSTIKPFTYLAAFERGWTPATMLMDVSQDFPDGANPPYRPHNYDGKEWGPISLRQALACSRNIPAVSTLHQIGVSSLVEMAQRVGIQSLNRSDYGLALTLGGGEATLLEMTTAYAVLANGGHAIAPTPILYVEDSLGNLVAQRKSVDKTPIIDPRHAYLITDILADNEARKRAFGENNALALPFPAAAKTGTTDDFRDSWTIGYTPQLVVGVWVGNSDGTPMENLSGARGAGIIWHRFMVAALANEPHPDFRRPAGIVEVEVCPISGKLPTKFCPPARKELFLAEQVPTDRCTVHVEVRVCKATNALAGPYCPQELVQTKVYEDYGPEWDAWALAHGIEPPPREMCPVHSRPANVAVDVPIESSAGVIAVRGSTDVPDFAYYYVEYGEGSSPSNWRRITPDIRSPIRQGILCQWDASALPEGTFAVQVVVVDGHGYRYRARDWVRLRESVLSFSPRLPELTPSVTVGAVPHLPKSAP